MGVCAAHWQMLHRERVMWNMRNADDVGRFLADPVPADIHEHKDNLRRLQQERRYHRGWTWHRLRARWGEKALHFAGMFEHDFF